VDKPAVVNAWPLIFLARGDLIDLLKLTGTSVIVPLPVANEVRFRGPNDPAARALENYSWIVVVESPPVPELISAWDLGKGESSVLAWAHAHEGTEAIMDDLAARRCAAALGIPVRGTLGLVLVAKQRGVIPSARSTLQKLRYSGMYLSDRTLNEALALVGE
jgi:predicted nucleic acid-binding protein